MKPTTASVHPPASQEFQKFASRRSVVHSTKGIVACTQPLAAKCGIDVLNAGGNAADAAVAVAAGLNLTEPTSTGIGGDMFCLFYDAATWKVSALNGSGRMPSGASLEKIHAALGIPEGEAAGRKIPPTSVHAVTVPGAAAGWIDTVERFGSGKLSMLEILSPAIELAEQGYPVSENSSYHWRRAEKSLRDASPNFAEWLKADPSAPDGFRAPNPGEIKRHPTLAKTFRTLAKEGKKGFYTGRIAEEIVKVCKDLGGLIELEDLKHHLEMGSEPVDPISLKFQGQGLNKSHDGAGIEVWEHPPNGQGIVALIALGIIQELEKAGTIPTWDPKDHNTAPYLHAIIDALRIGFADASWYVTDPKVVPVPSQELLSSDYLASRAALFNASQAVSPDTLKHGNPHKFDSPAQRSSDTVYFSVSDSAGNAISFINSNYAGFGTAIVPRGCGFTLQNRGMGFSLDPAHPNVLAPRKRPYHTIIPALATDLRSGALHSVFGVMGGYMQPQGHVQVLLGQVVGKLNPQQALDAPRICIGGGMPDATGKTDATVYVEEGMPEETVEGLRKLGHQVEVVTGFDRAQFGRGQIIRYSVDAVEGTRVWSAGSDSRGDGAAYPQ